MQNVVFLPKDMIKYLVYPFDLIVSRQGFLQSVYMQRQGTMNRRYTNVL